MNALVLIAFLLVRIAIPISLLIAIGEWIRRREANYWLQK